MWGVFENSSFCWLGGLTDAKDHLRDVNGEEVHEEEGEDDEDEAQNHTNPLLEPFTCRRKDPDETAGEEEEEEERWRLSEAK